MKHSEAKNNLSNAIQTVREEISAGQKGEIESLREFVRNAMEKVNSNNDGICYYYCIYEKYDEKLKKIKDVCAQYFSKYEKHLINH